MRLRCASIMTVLGAVTFGSCGMPSSIAWGQGTHAQVAGMPAGSAPAANVPAANVPAANTPTGVTVRLDAIDAVPRRAAPEKPAPAKPPRAAARKADTQAQTRTIFIDEQSSWIAPAAAAQPVIDTPGFLQCVPYARMVSGIGLRGDAWTWWEKATGTYARGNHPEPGAVLAFPGIERMPLGHVAVVTHVLSARKILIDHANWPTATTPHGAISREILVLDVSPANDWTEVRVQFGTGGPLGGAYPTHGFIYGWSEAGVQIARPAFSLQYALWSPVAPTWRMFNPIAYSWALPAGARPKAYAALSRPPGGSGQGSAGPGVARSTPGKPALLLSSAGPALNGSALGQTLGVNRLDVGPGARPRMDLKRFVLQ